MSKYRIIKLEEFEKSVEKTFSKNEKEQLENIYDELSEKGNLVGKPLTYEFLREKRLKEKRIYFLVYEEIILILLVGTSNKKNQKETIENIKTLLPLYKKLVYDEFI